MKGDSTQSDTIMGGVGFTLQFEEFSVALPGEEAQQSSAPELRSPQLLANPFRRGFLRLTRGGLHQSSTSRSTQLIGHKKHN